MNDIITIPAGVIMPKDLLMWLRKRRDAAQDEANLLEDQDAEGFNYWLGAYATYNEVIQHISSGGAS